MKPWVWFSILVLLILGCGGGGGSSTTGGGQNVTITGRVVWIVDGGPPSPSATVRAGSNSVATEASDGFFSVVAPSGIGLVTVTYTPAGGSAVVFNFTFDPATSNKDLGDLYIGPETVSVTGVIRDSTTSSPVAGAVVSLGGKRTSSAADGRFTLTQVAYSSNGQAVFFGLQGTVERSGYFNGFFSPGSAPVGGVVDVGTISLTPEGGSEPPPLPFNISGQVLPSGSGAFAAVELRSGPNVIRTGTATATGTFTFWAPTGSYTVVATKGALTGSANVTVAQVNQVSTVNVTIN
ncbi:MAG: hypothetical protein KF812_08270 [Fimbriimonadaceae bacterium]|nr:hypothetical protein [Fimbriimonadaceae bacterium]